MAKVTWGGSDLESTLNDWEPDQGYNSYAGDRPPKGVYRFKLVRLERQLSTGGFPQMVAHFELDPHKPEHKKYKGYYMRDYIVVKDDGSTAFRVRPFLDAAGVTAKQFRTGTVDKPTDRQTPSGEPISEIIKMGPVKIEGLQLFCHIRPDNKRNPEYELIKYMPNQDDASDDADDADDDTDDGDDDKDGAPF